jgi:poly-beta-1,6-N-acetyl-D-glucosamine N-deacetylase
LFYDSIPVICYHRVDKADSITPAVFESHLAWLRKQGIRTLLPDEFRYQLNQPEKKRNRTLLLTFDDGYRDFYHQVFPLLKRYDARALVFLIADRVVQAEPAFDGRTSISYDAIHRLASQGDYRGFLSLEQLLEMKASGRVAFGGHSMHHSVSIISSEVVGIYRGQPLKWYTRQQFALELGAPLFRLGPALWGPRFIPDADFIACFQKLAADGCLSQGEIEVRLSKHLRGRWEDPIQWRQRLQRELVESRQRLQRMLGETIDSFCWPWGITGETAERYLSPAGYRLAFTLQRGSNAQPADAMQVKRFSARRKGGYWLASRLLVYGSCRLSSYYERRQRPTRLTPPSLAWF